MNLLYISIKSWNIIRNELDVLTFKMVSIHKIGGESFQWMNQTIFIKYFCYDFWIVRYILFAIIIVTCIFFVPITFVNILLVLVIFTPYLFMIILFKFIITVINFNIVIFLDILFIFIMFVVILTTISFVNIIFISIILTRILFFCTFDLSQIKIGWPIFAFTWLDSLMTSSRWIFWRSSFFCIHVVILFFFSVVTWILIDIIFEREILESSESLFSLLYVIIMWATSLPVLGITDNCFVFSTFLISDALLFLLNNLIVYQDLGLFHAFLMCPLIDLIKLVNIHFFLKKSVWIKWKYNKKYK